MRRRFSVSSTIPPDSDSEPFSSLEIRGNDCTRPIIAFKGKDLCLSETIGQIDISRSSFPVTTRLECAVEYVIGKSGRQSLEICVHMLQE